MDWKIYYDDRSTFSDLDGSWREAPQHGVICVVVRDPTETWGRFVNSGPAPHKGDEMYERAVDDLLVQLSKLDSTFVQHAGLRQLFLDWVPRAPYQGSEFFVKRPDNSEPYPTYDLGPFKELFDSSEDAEPYIKYGRQVGQVRWQEVMNNAVNDPDFPTGKSPRRRKTDFQRATP